MKKTCLEATDLCKTYIVDGYSNNVLQNINLKIEEGEFVSIMGPSGSGKSTLLYTISGMDNMTAGTVIFDGEDLSKMNEKQLTKLRLLKMGFIFQQMYMMKKLCILDNIVLPGYQAGRERRQLPAETENRQQTAPVKAAPIWNRAAEENCREGSPKETGIRNTRKRSMRPSTTRNERIWPSGTR